MKTLRSWFVFFLVIISMGCKKKNGAGGTTSDQAPAITIEDASTTEGNTALKEFQFTVTLSKSFSRAITVQYNTVEGTAKAGGDFVAITNGVLNFQPGETNKTISVSVVGDDLKEGAETFSVRLSNASAGFFARESGFATIIDDDVKISFNNNGYDAPASYANYTLAWSDEFNTSQLDESAWSYDVGDGCPNLCGFGNNELQYYTNTSDNLFFQDGKLIIEAKQQALGGKNYTSSRIKTAGKKAIKFGRIDIRAKLPKGKGIWPALWMLPQSNKYGNWPTSGEIDIMELVGHEPSKVHGTLHFGPGPGSTQISKSYILSNGTFYDEFHVFSIEWDQDVIKWYIDGNLYSTAEKSAFGNNIYPFNEDFYFIINLAVGGNWPGSPDASTQFPQWLIVDYVRVHQKP
jgi:beta-glucanase (GH16 family)